jgi:hypothetical protein
MSVFKKGDRVRQRPNHLINLARRAPKEGVVEDTFFREGDQMVTVDGFAFYEDELEAIDDRA